MANKNWVKGGPSPNPAGRKGIRRVRKKGNEQIRDNIARAFKKCFPPAVIVKLIQDLKTPREKLEAAKIFLPYLLPQQSNVTVSQWHQMSIEDREYFWNKLTGGHTIDAESEVLGPGVELIPRDFNLKQYDES